VEPPREVEGYSGNRQPPCIDVVVIGEEEPESLPNATDQLFIMLAYPRPTARLAKSLKRVIVYLDENQLQSLVSFMPLSKISRC
jgi:hypothetical protein